MITATRFVSFPLRGTASQRTSMMWWMFKNLSLGTFSFQEKVFFVRNTDLFALDCWIPGDINLI